MNTSLDYGLISDGCTSVTQSTCLAAALNKLRLTVEDQASVDRVRHDTDCLDIDDPEEGLSERFDLYLHTMVDMAHRYLPPGGRLVLRFGGPEADDWFGVERDWQAETKPTLDSIETDLLKHSDFDSETIRAIFAIVRTDILDGGN